MDWLTNLFNPNLATPRRVCSGLPAEWITLHTASDLLIWLAYISIPLILLVSIRRNTLTGLRMPVVMFALFILACGTTHLVEALMFEYPVYYLSGLMKAVTAVVSWLTVFLVVPVVPKLLARLAPEPAPAVGERPASPPLVYALAILVGVVVVLLRYSLNGLMSDLHPFHVPMLGVVLVAWYGGFRPGLVTLAVVTGLITYLFLQPANSFQVERLSDVFGICLFVFAGLGVCVLGQLQQTSRQRLLGQMRAVSAASAALADEKRATERAMGQLDALVGNAPYAIAFFDDQLRFLRVNAALTVGTGLGADGHIGRTLQEVRPDTPADLVADFRRILAGGPPMVGRIAHARGGVWEVSAFAVPVDGARLGMGVIAKDVTERHTASERVKESEAKLRAMADGIPQLAWMARPDGHIFWYNRRWHDYTGTTPEEMEGWGWQKVHDPEELKRVMVTWPTALASGEPFEDTFPLRRHDGEMRWHLTRAIPTKDADGKVVLWFGTNTDVTEQRKLEADLREREGRFRQLAEAMPQMVWMTRPDGYHEYYNARWYEYTGKAPADSIGWGWADLLHPDDAERSKRRWEQSTTTGEPYEIEYRFRRADGVYRWFLGRANPVRDESGTVVRWLGTCTDIDDRKQAADALAESEAYIRGVLDNSPDCIKVLSPGGLLIEFNDPGLVAMGLDDITPLLGKAWTDLWPEEGKGRVREAVAAAAAGRVDRFSGWCPTFKGEAKFWDVIVAPIPDASGAVVRLVGVSRDVTEQKRAEEVVREQKRYYEEVVNSLPVQVSVIEGDGRIVSVNRTWRQFGTDYGLLPGHSWEGTSYFTPATADGPSRPDVQLTAGIKSLLAGEQTEFSLEYRSDGVDGERYFHMRASRFHGDGPARVVVTHENVTDRVKAEQEVREAKRFSESVLHSLPSHLVVIDADGRIVSVNESWTQFAAANGLPADHDWTRENYFSASHTDRAHGERAVVGIKAVARGERPAFEMEYPCHSPTEERFFLLRASRFRGDGPVRLVVTHENVTDRVVAERGVREQANQLLQLTEGMPFLMWACRPTGECDYLSRQWVEYTGGHLNNQLGYGWLNALHPDDRERTDAAWQAAVGGLAEFDVEYRLRRHDGEYRWFAVRGIPLQDHAGRIVKWYGSCADIDDRKRQEETLERLVTERTAALHQANGELVQQQAFVDAILDNVTEGVVACDTAGRLKLFNAATRAMHALPAEPLDSGDWADHYRLFEADGITPMNTDRVPLVRAWQGEVVKDAEMVIRPADPTADERFVVCSGQPLRTPAGEPFGAVVSMRDMTQRREYERQLLRTTAALEASNDDLEKFAYIASHDLQEPLRKIQAFGDRLATKFRDPLGEQGKDYLDRMLDSATRMRRLIEDLLAFSRVNTRTKRAAVVDLNDVVRGVLDDLSEQLARTGGRVEVGTLPTLPADAGQLRQVFQNLIGNALKFHRTDAPPVVSLSSVPFASLPADDRPSADGWRITLSDNGIGFEPQHADRIFELFQRLHGRSKFEGTGLGLAIVKKIVTRHGGSIRARSTPGSGATFTIDWPGTPAEASP